jgi:hypothetical protein
VASPSVLLAHHRENNRQTADGWDSFATHRQHVTELVCAHPSESLAIFGAGNCNDIDLGAVTQAYAHVHLFDLDRESVTRACEAQPPEIADRLVNRTPIDLSGAHSWMEKLGSRPVSPESLATLPDEALQRIEKAIPERFDTIVSTCLLSQLMHSCTLILRRHPQLPAIAGAVGVAHLRSLLTLLRPGGCAVFITDMVSTETYPLEELWSDRKPLALVEYLEATGNFLSGTALSQVRRTLAGDPVIASLLAESPRIVEPWLWHLGPEQTRLVYALVLTRKEA